MCCHQEIAARAHIESEDSMNRGNFREILELLARHDDIVRDKLHHGQRNSVYTSPDIQNFLIDAWLLLFGRRYH